MRNRWEQGLGATSGMVISLSMGYLMLRWLSRAFGDGNSYAYQSSTGTASQWLLWFSVATVILSLLTGLLLTAVIGGRFTRSRLGLVVSALLATWMALITASVATAASSDEPQTVTCTYLSNPPEYEPC